jgi:hypothetical protein
MSSRFLITVLCVAAIALACGPRAHNEVSSPSKNSSVVTHLASTATLGVAQQVAPRIEQQAKSVTPTVAAQLYVHAGDANIRFALHVVNTSRKRIELTFPSGQTYDFVILDTLGREMWRWASGRMFTQALRNKPLSGGEAMEFEETMKATMLPPGKYTARALLKSVNFPLVQEAPFTLAPTTIASR